MARVDTLRPDAGTPRATNPIGPAAGTPAGLPAGLPNGARTGTAEGSATGPALAAFRGGRSESERTADLLAFAIAAERGLASTPDGVERARREADAALGDYSLRYLHNNVEQIRQEAVIAHLGRMRPPPGFLKLVASNLVAVAIAGALTAWLWSRPDVQAALAGLLGI